MYSHGNSHHVCIIINVTMVVHLDIKVMHLKVSCVGECIVTCVSYISNYCFVAALMHSRCRKAYRCQLVGFLLL